MKNIMFTLERRPVYYYIPGKIFIKNRKLASTVEVREKP